MDAEPLDIFLNLEVANLLMLPLFLMDSHALFLSFVEDFRQNLMDLAVPLRPFGAHLSQDFE
jgi:hypothetical protein